MKNLVHMDGTGVVFVDHDLMIVEEKPKELLLLKVGEDLARMRQAASRASLFNGSARTIDLYAMSSNGNISGWTKVCSYRCGILVQKIRRATA